MTIYKPTPGQAQAPAVTPRNWDPVIGISLIVLFVILVPLMYIVASGIRASYLPGVR